MDIPKKNDEYSTIAVDVTDSKPSLSLKLKTYLHWNGLFMFCVLFNVCILFNIAQSRIYLIASYALFFALTPGRWGCEYDDGCVWRKFSETYCFPCSTMRDYLQMSLTDRPPHKDFVKEEALPNAQFIFATFPHGTGCEYRIVMEGVLRQVMPNIISKNNFRSLAASVLFYIPIIRELSLWSGCINASRKTAEWALDR